MIINHDFGSTKKTTLKRSGEQKLGITIFVGLGWYANVSAGPSSSSEQIEMTAGELMNTDLVFFKQLAPRLILTPLLSSGFDALDFAQKLQQLGFKGRYRALVSHLPHETVIVREVNAAAPAINFGVTELSGLTMRPF